MFYLHHSFTFMVSELAMRHLRNDSSLPSGPYFGLDSLHGVRECAAATITVTSPSLLPTSCLTRRARLSANGTPGIISCGCGTSLGAFRWVVEGEM